MTHSDQTEPVEQSDSSIPCYRIAKTYHKSFWPTYMRQFVCLMEAPSVCIHQKHWHGFKLKSNKLSAVTDVENRRRRNEGEPNFCINSDFVSVCCFN